MHINEVYLYGQKRQLWTSGKNDGVWRKNVKKHMDFCILTKT